jgi:AcrR family transcriptional regulator
VKSASPVDEPPAGPPGDRGTATRRRIIEAATELVVERGYDGMSTADVLERAGVSRGGLYHHFSGKGELLAAVLETLEFEVLAKLASVAGEAPDAFSGLRRAMDWYLDECMTSPVLQRVGLLEGRRALGWEEWRRVISPLGLAFLSGALSMAIEEGSMQRGDPDALALLLVAALHEATAVILSAEDPAAERQRTGQALGLLLEGLRSA